jgi:hypothetical protein
MSDRNRFIGNGAPNYDNLEVLVSNIHSIFISFFYIENKISIR